MVSSLASSWGLLLVQGPRVGPLLAHSICPSLGLMSPCVSRLSEPPAIQFRYECFITFFAEISVSYTLFAFASVDEKLFL